VDGFGEDAVVIEHSEHVDPGVDDRTAWGAVYDTHAHRLNGIATLLVGRDDAHDLVADAVLRAVSSRAWSGVENQGAYLTRSLVHLADDRRTQADRRQRREAKVLHLSRQEPGSNSDQPRGSQPDVDRRIIVEAALGSLSSSQLAVVYFHYWEDWTLDQVASHLGLSGGTVRRHLDRAKRRLHIVLGSAHLEGNINANR
jgi:RNA polymerase sigma factor (sigma-70 family)